MEIPKEYPKYLICPVCKKEIKLYLKELKHGKGALGTEDILSVGIEIKALLTYDIKEPEKALYSTPIFAQICNHCKGIIGITSGEVYPVSPSLSLLKRKKH